MSVIVRIAPSPTGLIHVGNVRAAILNWLFARRHGGRFMLRLDDTDRERSRAEYEAAIAEDLRWLGLDWDLYARQSDRLDRYAAVVEDLRARGLLYPCFESEEELALKRKAQLAQGRPPLYDRAALRLSGDEVSRLSKTQAPHWRFRLPDAPAGWDDFIQGPKRFEAAALSDPVLVRADGMPVYSLSSVVDDLDFSITHVIRGEDHVANTAVQWHLFQAIGGRVPHFAHYPLLSLSTGEELSKRLGSMSIRQLRTEGIFPLPLLSYLARIGTSHAIELAGDLSQLAAELDLGQISRAPPKFDLDELRRLNARLLHRLDYTEIAPILAEQGMEVPPPLWQAVRGNLLQLGDIREWLRLLDANLPVRRDEPDFLQQAVHHLPAAPWDATSWGQWTQALAAATGRKGKSLFLPLRRALTGQEHGPEMKDILPLLPRDLVLRRLGGADA